MYTVMQMVMTRNDCSLQFYVIYYGEVFKSCTGLIVLGGKNPGDRESRYNMQFVLLRT